MKTLVFVISVLVVVAPFANASDSLIWGEEVYQYAANAHEAIHSNYADLGKLMGWGDGKPERPSPIDKDGDVAARISTELLAGITAIVRFEVVASLLLDCDCPESKGCVSLVVSIFELRMSRDLIQDDLRYIHNHSLSVLANDVVKHLGKVADALEGGISGQPCPKQYIDSLRTRYEQRLSGSN